MTVIMSFLKLDFEKSSFSHTNVQVLLVTGGYAYSSLLSSTDVSLSGGKALFLGKDWKVISFNCLPVQIPVSYLLVEVKL